MSIGNPDLPETVMAASRNEVNGSGTAMRFPSEHGRYFTMLRFVKYQRLNPKRLSTRVEQASIILPLPSNLLEYYAINYGDESFNQLGGALNTAETIVNQYIKGGGMSQENLYDIGKIAGSGFTEWSQALSRGTANYFSPELSSIIDRVQGNVVNPHITAVFKGVGLREHQLSWRLSAKSAAESNEIKGIRDFIRSRMHPEKKSEFLLNFPDEVYVKFFANGKEILYPIFKAVVTSVSGSLSSDGTNAFFKDTDEPVIVDLNLTLKEVEAITREDFEKLQGEQLPDGAIVDSDIPAAVNNQENLGPAAPVVTLNPDGSTT